MPRVFRLDDDGAQEVAVGDTSSLDAITRQLPAGLYTSFRTFQHGRGVLKLRLHLRRLYAPARQRGILPAVDGQRLRQILATLLDDLSGEARLRLVLTFQGEVYLAIEPFSPLPDEVYAQGVRLITVPLHRVRPGLKATHFIEISQQARQQVQAEGAFEALMVYRGRILEGLTSNFFYVRSGCLGTARRGVLPGVTRRIVLSLARSRGVALDDRPLPLSELAEISEAFLTSSSRGIVPVVQIDAVRVGEGRPGRVTRCLMEAYQTYVERNVEPIWPPTGRSKQARDYERS
jgi:branched-chain amino acid aminotransferase